MKKLSKNNKLQLTVQTLRVLDAQQLGEVAAGSLVGLPLGSLGRGSSTTSGQATPTATTSPINVNYYTY